MSDTSPQQQVDIFANDNRQRHFAELCNALYERELYALGKKAPNNIKLLQRRLSGLPYHIKNAAEYLLDHTAPIEVDIHNGSWQAKQSAKCVVQKHNSEKSQSWFHSHASMGLPVPVYVNDMGIESIELDSIDRIEQDSHRLHVNKHGWFHLDGSFEGEPSHPHQKKVLLLPNKLNLTAACCGHTWNHKGKSVPRALSLRELLLSTKINWKTFKG
ncbi:MAG: hypothetical protein Alis3KO_12310 [Aliiglaciecola sp.]|uniref:hypothetical protein n=1 Tax=Aliiglaciecola sp. M165 TaxID=2593649 RepID=UPI00117BF3F6|nr:hypothetical protein [Aliiglaciecola sp. M165]TRY32166.1 hypothetical protein FM019_08225 [Aliiglaciecola sp. M165]